MKLSKKFDEAYAKLAEAKEEWEKLINKSGLKLIKSLLKQFFKACPEVEELSLVGYTPYFNDGDACTFYLHDMNLKLSDKAPKEMMEYFKDYEENIDHYALSNFAEENLNHQDLVNSITKNLDKVSNYIDDDMFLTLWGDHVEVTFTRDEITSNEYSHN